MKTRKWSAHWAKIEMLKEYTTIQQYRYQDKFSVDIDISDDLLSYPVPRFILQPIVENSIFHGITPKTGQGTIWISAAITEEHFVLLVDDDGIDGRGKYRIRPG